MRQHQMGLIMSSDVTKNNNSSETTIEDRSPDLLTPGEAIVGAMAAQESTAQDVLVATAEFTSTEALTNSIHNCIEKTGGESRQNVPLQQHTETAALQPQASTIAAGGDRAGGVTLDMGTIASVAAEAVGLSAHQNKKIDTFDVPPPGPIHQSSKQVVRNPNNVVYSAPGATRQTRYGKKAQGSKKATTPATPSSRVKKAVEKEKEKKVSGLGRGKGLVRMQQSHKRGRQDLDDYDEAASTAKVEVANTDLDKLWTNCGRQLQPLRRTDQTKLNEMEQTLLEGWGIDPRKARSFAKNYKGTWLKPMMDAPAFANAFLDLIPSYRREVRIPLLGRPYSDVWIEEIYVEMLREEDAEAAQGDACLQRRLSNASTAATPCAVGNEPVTVTGERRSLRGGSGRRGVGLGGTGGGGGCGGSAGGSGGDGEAGGWGGRAVILPCCKTVSRWQDLVPSHDEARFRESLAAARQRLNAPREFGFCPEGHFYYSDDEEQGAQGAATVEVGKGVEMTAAAVQQQQPPPPEEKEAAAGAAGESVENAPGYRRQLRHRGPTAEHFKYKPDGCFTSTTSLSSASSTGVADRSSDRSSNKTPATPTPTTTDTKSTNSESDSNLDTSGPPTTPNIPINKALVPVWKGTASNSICHPILPPRRKKKPAAYMARKPPAPLPAAAAARAPVTSPAGSLRSAAVVGSGEGVGNKSTAADGAGETVGVVDKDDDEVSRELRHAWDVLKRADALVLHKVVELEGLCRQERCLQNVWERASDTQSLLCSSLSLSQLGKGVERADKVGLSDDFPYYDPFEEPVINARRAQKDADQSLTWLNEETMGLPQDEIEEERAKRQKMAETAATTVDETERHWLPRRLAAGREGQKGRGRGVPIPGGVAHPFLIGRGEADFLYSIGLGDSVEAQDEWGAWCRGKVVAVRGEGGWSTTDTNVLRAVKISFKGWGPAMDVWLPVDSGMLAKPGTHLPKKGSPSRGKRPPNRVTTEPPADGTKSDRTSVKSFPLSATSRLHKREAVAAHTNGSVLPTVVPTFTPTATTATSLFGGKVDGRIKKPSDSSVHDAADASRTLGMVVDSSQLENAHRLAPRGGCETPTVKMSPEGVDYNRAIVRSTGGSGTDESLLRASALKRRREESLPSSPSDSASAWPTQGADRGEHDSAEGQAAREASDVMGRRDVETSNARDLKRPTSWSRRMRELKSSSAGPGNEEGHGASGWMPSTDNQSTLARSALVDGSDHQGSPTVESSGGPRVVLIDGVRAAGDGEVPYTQPPAARSAPSEPLSTNRNDHAESEVGDVRRAGALRIVAVAERIDDFDLENQSSRTRPLKTPPPPNSPPGVGGGQEQPVNLAAVPNDTCGVPAPPHQRTVGSAPPPNEQNLSSSAAPLVANVVPEPPQPPPAGSSPFPNEHQGDPSAGAVGTSAPSVPPARAVGFVPSPNGGQSRPFFTARGRGRNIRGRNSIRGHKGGVVPRSGHLEMSSRDVGGDPVSGLDMGGRGFNSYGVGQNGGGSGTSGSSNANKKKKFVSPWAGVGVVAWNSNKIANGGTERQAGAAADGSSGTAARHHGPRKQPSAVKPMVPPAVAAFRPPSSPNAPTTAKNDGRGPGSRLTTAAAAALREKPPQSSEQPGVSRPGVGVARGIRSGPVGGAVQPASTDVAYETAIALTSIATATGTASATGHLEGTAMAVGDGDGDVGVRAAGIDAAVDACRGESEVRLTVGTGDALARDGSGAGFDRVDNGNVATRMAIPPDSLEKERGGKGTGTGSGFVNANRPAADNSLKVVLRRG